MTLVVRCLVLLAACSILGVEGQHMEKMQSGRQMRLLHAGMDVDGNDSVSIDEGSGGVQMPLCTIQLSTWSLAHCKLLSCTFTNTVAFTVLSPLLAFSFAAVLT